MRNGTYQLMFIGWVYNRMRNGTYPLLFIGRVYNSMRNGTYQLMFIGRVYNSLRNWTYPLLFIGRVYNSMRNGTYPLMFRGSTCDTLASSAANQGDNTVSVAEGGTSTPGATEQLLLPDKVFKRNIYIYISLRKKKLVTLGL